MSTCITFMTTDGERLDMRQVEAAEHDGLYLTRLTEEGCLIVTTRVRRPLLRKAGEWCRREGCCALVWQDGIAAGWLDPSGRWNEGYHPRFPVCLYPARETPLGELPAHWR